MSVFLYKHDKYTQYTHIYCIKKTTIILDVINRLTSLLQIIL